MILCSTLGGTLYPTASNHFGFGCKLREKIQFVSVYLQINPAAGKPSERNEATCMDKPEEYLEAGWSSTSLFFLYFYQERRLNGRPT